MQPAASQASGRAFMAPFSLGGLFGLVGGRNQTNAAGVAAQCQVGTAEGQRWAAAATDLGVAHGRPGERWIPLESVQALILSRHYWPQSLQNEDYPNMRLPPVMEDALSAYAECYSKIRATRRLVWKRTYGTVDMNIELEDRQIQVTVTPIHAAVLQSFQQEQEERDRRLAEQGGGSEAGGGQQRAVPVKLSVVDLATRLELPEELVRRRANFWVSKGVLREVRPLYIKESRLCPHVVRPRADRRPKTAHLCGDLFCFSLK